MHILYSQQELGSWISTWYLVTAWTTDTYLAFGVSTCHEHQHGFQWQNTPWTPTWSGAAWPTDINMDSCGSRNTGPAAAGP